MSAKVLLPLLVAFLIGEAALVGQKSASAPTPQRIDKQDTYTGPITLQGILADLIAQKDKKPTAQSLGARYEPRATPVRLAASDPNRPWWASSGDYADDVFIELNGDLAGIRLSDDSRGWFTSAEIRVLNGTLADVEAVIGPTRSRMPDPHDFVGPLHFGTLGLDAFRGKRPPSGTVMLRVIAQLEGWKTTRVHHVTVFFDRVQ
jgi:hypothetical protein